MTYATAYQLHETKNYIVDYINTVINHIASRLKDGHGRTTQLTQIMDYKIREIASSLDTITLSISARRRDDIPPPSNREVQREFSAGSSDSVNRTFFTNLNAALDATENLLNHVPPTRHVVPPISLPLDELYGLLHALHRGTLEWLTHISHDTEQIANGIHALQTDLLSEVRLSNRKTDAVLEKLADLAAKLGERPELNSESDLVKTMHSIETQIHGLVSELRETTSGKTPKSSSSSGTLADTNTAAAHLTLPTYIPEHPTARCRSYGSVEFGGATFHVPMDIKGRRASTALRLLIKHTIERGSTAIKYELFDDGALLLTEEMNTPHKLNQPLTDSLSLLHSKCTNFIYKIRDDGLY
uniref:TGB3 n=1 Tax=Garlic virus X TaxID=150284 RepID=A0A6M2YYA9_9VIRU|nr:TGB3 [Garlic virus X]